MNVIITGTAQGIGLELTKLALKEGHQVLAVARTKENAQELESLKTATLEIVYSDLGENGAIENLVQRAQKFSHIDVLINNAGIYRKGEDRKDFEDSFLINSIIPFQLAKGLLPLLKKSAHPKCANVSSIMGSIKDNTSGGAHAYRSSKTALNMLMRGLSLDEKWLTVLCLHPGWVQTRMGTDAAPVKPSDSAKGIWSVVDKVKLSESGIFLDYQGQELPW